MSRRLRFDRETLRRITDPLLLDDEKAEEFLKRYRKLRRMYEFLGAHPERLKYQEEFAALTEIYYTYLHRKRDFEETESYVKRYFPKTLEIIQKLIDIGKIEELFPIIKLDDSYLENLEKIYPDTRMKLYNMIFDLRRFIYIEKSRTPYLETIGERLNKIIKEIKERKIKTEEAYKRLKELISEVNEIQKRRIELNDRELSIILPIERIKGRSERLIKAVKNLINQLEEEGMFFPGWNQKTETTKRVGRRIRSLIRRLGLTFQEREKLYKEIMRGLTQVG